MLPDLTPSRRFPRRNVVDCWLVTVGLNAGPGGVLIDVSEGGMAIQPFVPLQEQAVAELEFALPGRDTRLRGSGLVAWVGESGRAGIRFLHPPDGLRAEIRSFVQEAEGESGIASLASAARELTGADGAAIALRTGENFTCMASVGDAPDVGVVVRQNVGLAGECLRSGRIVLCNDTEDDRRVDPGAAARLALRSTVLVPIVRDEQVLGFVQVLSARAHAFCGEHLSNLALIAERVRV